MQSIPENQEEVNEGVSIQYVVLPVPWTRQIASNDEQYLFHWLWRNACAAWFLLKFEVSPSFAICFVYLRLIRELNIKVRWLLLWRLHSGWVDGENFWVQCSLSNGFLTTELPRVHPRAVPFQFTLWGAATVGLPVYISFCGLYCRSNRCT